MALKTAEKPWRSPHDTVMLELALYTKYTWGDMTYEKGTPYELQAGRCDGVAAGAGSRASGVATWRQPKPGDGSENADHGFHGYPSGTSRISPDEIGARGTKTANGSRHGRRDCGHLEPSDTDVSGDVTV